MAKKKTTSAKTEEKNSVEKQSIWDQIVESVNEENKEEITKALQDAADFLGEMPERDQELFKQFLDTINKIK
jgi:hypothetical protein